MNSKIIGFTVSKDIISHSDIDIFDVGLNLIKKEYAGFNIYLWGIGEIEGAIVNGSYTLSFPYTSSLNDRNVLITLSEGVIIIDNDWLGSIPVYYNPVAKIISTLPLKCVRGKGVDSEGLLYYLQHGYALYGKTYRKDVCQMSYCSTLIIEEKFKLVQREDPALALVDAKENSDEVEVINTIRKYINEVENKIPNKIILPTSGGYDSRLLNALVTNKDRILSYTYGLSENSGLCYQVQYAKELSTRLNTQWKEIEFGDFWCEIGPWFKLYGQTTHLHGMYQIDFYRKIKALHKGNEALSLLSGIVGDMWSGGKECKGIFKYDQLSELSLSYGVNIEKKHTFQKAFPIKKKEFYLKNKKPLHEPMYQAVATIRAKITLLSYLMQVPEYFGFLSWSPFLNFNVASIMLRLPNERKKNRVWQSDYFKSNNIDIENSNFQNIQYYNNVMNDTVRSHEFEPLDVAFLEQYVNKSHLLTINKRMAGVGISANLYNYIMEKKWTEKLLRRGFGMKRAYVEYMVLKGLEMGLKA